MRSHAPDATKVLIVGYGNPLRGDDALGQQAGDELARRFEGRPEVQVVVAHCLLPEMAEPISRCELAIFVDASAQAPEGQVCRQEVEAAQIVTAALMHHVSPESLLACARHLFKHAPRALIYSVGVRQMGHAEALSAPVKAACAQVVRTVEAEVIRVVGPAPRGTGRAPRHA